MEFTEKRANLLKLAIDMATNGQRDRFADKPVAEISRMANQLAKLADEIIQVILYFINTFNYFLLFHYLKCFHNF